MHVKSAALAVILAAALSDNEADAFGVPRHHGAASSSAAVRASTFVPRGNAVRRPSPSSSQLRSTNAMTMFGDTGGKEELDEFVESFGTQSKTSKVPPNLLKLAGLAAVPVSWAVGAAMTPSRRLVARAVGGAITAVAGGVGKSALDEETYKAAPAAIARAIVEQGVDGPLVSDAVRKVRDVHMVEPDDFTEMCTGIYAKYLIGMAKNPICKTAELKELTGLRAALSLENLHVGEAHAAAATRFYRDVCRFTPQEELDDKDHPDRMSIDKMLFLSERAFRQNGETDEAFKYEMSRVAKAFDVGLEEALWRVADVAQPFYKRALASTRSKLDSGAVSSDMLSRARATLGIKESTAMDMHIDTFADEVKNLLGLPESSDDDDDEDEEDAMAGIDKSTLKFPEGAMERLEKLRAVLDVEEKDADYEITLAGSELWQVAALSAMEEAIAGTRSPSDAWTVMESRQKELCLKDEAMKNLLTSMVMQALGTPLEKTNTFAKVNNEAATYDMLLDALAAKGVCKEVLTLAGWEEFENFDEKCFDPRNPNSATGFLESDDRLKMYQIFLRRSIKKSDSGKEMTDEAYEKLAQIKAVLGITDAEAHDEIRRTFGPELSKALQTAMYEILSDDYTPELLKNMKELVHKVIDDYKLSEDMVKEYSQPLYMKAVTKVNQESPGGIPVKEKMDALEAFRDLLGMKMEEAHPAHLKVFGEAYKRGVLEALGSTGVIEKDFRAPLDDLRDRLGVSKEAGRKMFLDALEQRMIPMIDFIATETERTMLTTQQLAQKKGKDFGEDVFKSGKHATGKLGIGTEGNLMSDIMNLVDYYTENDIAEKKEVGTKTIEKKVPAEEEGGEEKTVTEEVPVYETTYPITALDSGCIEQQMAELLYRQFAVGSFTTQGPQGARYEAAKSTFGGILGLTSKKMEEIGSDIGGMVYDNYIGNAMQTKGALDQQDMMFLANIQSKLGISEETGEKMLLDSQKKILSEEVTSLLDKSPTPEQIKAFREKCNSMGMELESDVGISKARLVSMFEYEVSPGLASGDITPESGDLLAEIQESLGLTSEECEKVLEGILDKRSKAVVKKIQGELLRGREANAVDMIKRIVQYAAFVDGDLGLQVPEESAWQMYNLYDALDFSGEDDGDVERKKDLLKTALGLP